MLSGRFEAQIQNDGSFISKDFEEHVLVQMILEYKEKNCTVYFDKNNLDIIFSFNDSLSDDKNLIAVTSFITGDNTEKIIKQFCIPMEYLEYYSGKSVFVMGLMEEICISRKEIGISDYVNKNGTELLVPEQTEI